MLEHFPLTMCYSDQTVNKLSLSTTAYGSESIALYLPSADGMIFLVNE